MIAGSGPWHRAPGCRAAFHKSHRFLPVLHCWNLQRETHNSTNKYVWMHIFKKSSYSKRDGLWREATQEEMHKLIRLLVYMGIVQVPHLHCYWNKWKFQGFCLKECQEIGSRCCLPSRVCLMQSRRLPHLLASCIAYLLCFSISIHPCYLFSTASEPLHRWENGQMERSVRNLTLHGEQSDQMGFQIMGFGRFRN